MNASDPDTPERIRENALALSVTLHRDTIRLGRFKDESPHDPASVVLDDARRFYAFILDGDTLPADPEVIR